MPLPQAEKSKRERAMKALDVFHRHTTVAQGLGSRERLLEERGGFS